MDFLLLLFLVVVVFLCVCVVFCFCLFLFCFCVCFVVCLFVFAGVLLLMLLFCLFVCCCCCFAQAEHCFGRNTETNPECLFFCFLFCFVFALKSVWRVTVVPVAANLVVRMLVPSKGLQQVMLLLAAVVGCNVAATSCVTLKLPQH